MKRTAILVDGGFYRKRAKKLWGEKAPKDRALELVRYCGLHIKDGREERRELYRIFYYDCPPLSGNIFDPLTQKTQAMEKTPTYQWTNDFFRELVSMRKLAVRKGELLSSGRGYTLTVEATKKLLSRQLNVEDITNRDLTPMFQQKGVDIKIGIDILHLAYKGLVDQIILISGDSDFVPAAKIARVEGIDVVLDAMGQRVADSLAEHVDGLYSHWRDSRMTRPESVPDNA